MSPTIERFAGFPVPNWGGPLPGGGYRGMTEELDAIVAEAAERLAEEYGRDVVIRFNSDRRSGGAWLRDKATADTLVGLTAGLRPERITDEWYAERFGQSGGAIWHATKVEPQALFDPALVNQGIETHRYCYLFHPSQLGLAAEAATLILVILFVVIVLPVYYGGQP